MAADATHSTADDRQHHALFPACFFVNPSHRAYSVRMKATTLAKIRGIRAQTGPNARAKAGKPPCARSLRAGTRTCHARGVS